MVSAQMDPQSRVEASAKFGMSGANVSGRPIAPSGKCARAPAVAPYEGALLSNAYPRLRPDGQEEGPSSTSDVSRFGDTLEIRRLRPPYAHRRRRRLRQARSAEGMGERLLKIQHPLTSRSLLRCGRFSR